MHITSVQPGLVMHGSSVSIVLCYVQVVHGELTNQRTVFVTVPSGRVYKAEIPTDSLSL